MASGHVYIATSLDGFVARADHTLDWLMKQPTAGEEHGYDAFMASVDGLVMGRGSYQTVLGFDAWPYSKPVVVMSRTLDQSRVPDELQNKVRITDLKPVEVMKDLSSRGWARAYVDGGRVVQSFLREGLIEDLVITTVPILLGEGVRLFGPLDGDVDLELLGSKAFPSGLVQNHYRVVTLA